MKKRYGKCADELACKLALILIFNSLVFHSYRTLQPPEIQKATSYKSPSKSSNTDSEWKEPVWRNEYNCGREYKPSHNIAPTDITPVLISAAHFDTDETIESNQFPEFDEDDDNQSEGGDSSDQMLVPMLWGMIPFWHDSSLDYRKHGLTTNNCRLETMLESKLYKNAFHKGQRCVILCEGFYEWQTTDPKATKASERAAYYIYVPQRDGIRIEDKETWTNSVNDLKLLRMAGLFDIWTNASGEQMYSYTVITFESDDKLNWLHHRSPAILENDEAVADWIDFKRVTDIKYLVSLLKPAKGLEWHRVSNLVNNARNKSDHCNKRLGSGSVGNTPKNKMMQSWLTVKKRKSEENLDCHSDDAEWKKIKAEVENDDKK